LPKACQRLAKGLPKACQRLAKGLPKACQRLAKGLPKACQRLAKGLPKACQRLAEGPNFSVLTVDQASPLIMKRSGGRARWEEEATFQRNEATICHVSLQ
jgi:hypothetical protein